MVGWILLVDNFYSFESKIVALILFTLKFGIVSVPIDFTMLVGFDSPKVELDDALEDIVPISDVLRGSISISFLAKKQIIDNIEGIDPQNPKKTAISFSY